MSPNLGTCLDQANEVTRFERQIEGVEVFAPHVNNAHVRDLAFARAYGWIKFSKLESRWAKGCMIMKAS
jgi:hypothetical protein